MARCIEARAKIDIPLWIEKGRNQDYERVIIPEGTVITVMPRKHDWILCHNTGWWALDSEYIGKQVRVVSEC